MPESREPLEVLQDVGDVAGREAEFEPVRAHPRLGGGVGRSRGAGEKELDAVVDRAANETGSSPRRDPRKAPQRPDRAPRARKAAADVARETPARRSPSAARVR